MEKPMSTSEHSQPCQRQSRTVRLAIVVVFSLLTSLVLLGGGASARRAVSAWVKSSNKPTHSVERVQTLTPGIGQQSNTPPPANLPHQSAPSLGSETPSGNQVYIGFDDVASGTI